ncbi:MAG: hypothetical protein WCG55_00555 [bacterium]
MFSKWWQSFKLENELIDSTRMAIEDRLSSPFYGYFISSWFLFNWKIIYIAFFVDQNIILQKTTLLRSDYLIRSFPILWSWEFWLHFFIYPFFATVLFFWIFPYLTREYYRKSIRNKKALRIIEIKETKQETIQEKELIEEQVKKAIIEQEVEVSNPKVFWEKDFQAFKDTNLFEKFQMILDGIYKYNGDVKWNWNGARYTGSIDNEILVFCDLNGLVNIHNGNKITLTDKGKFFARKYIEIKSQP